MKIVRVVIRIDEVPPVGVIHIPVPIVIDAVVRHFARVAPKLALKIRMRALDARIDHRDNNSLSSTFRDIPSLLGIDPIEAVHLTLRKKLVVRNIGRVHRLLPLGEDNIRTSSQSFDGGIWAQTFSKRDAERCAASRFLVPRISARIADRMFSFVEKLDGRDRDIVGE